jgi:hypothetical protein
MADFRVWNSSSTSVSHAGTSRPPADLVVDAGSAERVQVQEIAEGYLKVFGAAPILGRSFTTEMEREGAAPVVLLGHGYWRRRFGARPEVLGKTLRVSGSHAMAMEVATIIGVAPEGFEPHTDVWRPLIIPTASLARRSGATATSVARLRDNITLAHAESEMASHLAGAQDSTEAVTVHLTPLLDITTSL